MDIKNEALLEMWLELSEVLASKSRTIIPIVFTP